jgi:hypothetical protein
LTGREGRASRKRVRARRDINNQRAGADAPLHFPGTLRP